MKKPQLVKLQNLVLFLVGILIFSSCSEKGPKHLKAIPANTAYVVSINTYALAQKADLKNTSSLKNFSDIMKSYSGKDSETSNLLDEFMKDPKSTGINFQQNLLLYSTDINSSSVYATAELISSKKFEEFYTKLCTSLNTPYEIKEQKGYSVAYMDETPFIGWDKDKLVFITPEYFRDNESTLLIFDNLFNLPDDGQITTNEAFNKFYTNKKDIGFWMNFESIIGDQDFSYATAQFPYDMKQTYLQYYLSFENNKVVLSGNFVPNEELRKIMDKFSSISSKLDERLLKYLPEQSYLAMSGATDTKELMKLMTEEKAYAEMIQKVNKELSETGFTFEDIIGMLKGSFIASLHGMSFVNYDFIPYFSVVADLNDRKVIDQLLALIPEGVMVDEGSYYSIATGEFPMYLAMDDKTVLLSSDQNVINGFKDGGLSSNMSSSSLKKNMKDHPFYAYLNLNYSDYPTSLRQELKGANLIINLVDELLASAEMVAHKDSTFEFIINTDNKEGNSLRALIEMIDKLAVMF